MLPTGSRYRAHVELAEAKQLGASGVEVVWRLTYEVEGQSKPCCVADIVFRYYS
jgi:acyl dehydratase